MDRIHIVGIAGSLRKDSYNKALLRAAEAMLPEDMELEMLDLAPLPFYNEDLDKAGPPEAVRRFKEKIAAADAVLIATPEYNYSLPAVLKNAIDWASRPITQNVLKDKPVAIMGASTGVMGTVRAQLHLRQVFVFTDSRVLTKPELMVARAQEKFDAEGHLTDQATRDQLRALLEAFDVWIKRLEPERFKQPAIAGGHNGHSRIQSSRR